MGQEGAIRTNRSRNARTSRSPSNSTHGHTASAAASSDPGVENPTAEVAISWVTTSIGLEAKLADGSRITPPWAN